MELEPYYVHALGTKCTKRGDVVSLLPVEPCIFVTKQPAPYREPTLGSSTTPTLATPTYINRAAVSQQKKVYQTIHKSRTGTECLCCEAILEVNIKEGGRSRGSRPILLICLKLVILVQHYWMFCSIAPQWLFDIYLPQWRVTVCTWSSAQHRHSTAKRTEQCSNAGR